MVEGALTVLAIVIGLAAAGEAISEFLIAPIYKRAMKKLDPDSFWLPYVAAVPGFALAMLSGQNILAGYLPAQFAIAGRLVTAVMAGRGSNYVHQFITEKLKGGELAELRKQLVQSVQDPALTDEDRAVLTEYHDGKAPEA